jgi:hypothetical protein
MHVDFGNADDTSDFKYNQLLNAIHTNETPLLTEVIATLRL